MDDHISDRAPFPRSEPVDGSSNSLLESYRASMKEARLSIKHKEDEISILKREKEDYALMSEQRLREKEDEIAHMWDRLETMQSYQETQKRVSIATGDQPRNEDDHIPISEDTFSEGIKDCHVTYEKCRLNLPEYSQIAPVKDDVRVPSITSTPLVRHSGVNVNPESRIEKVTLKGTEQQDWRNEFKNIASDIVSKTNVVLLLKTLNEHNQYAKRSKDLLDEEIAEMRRDLELLRPSYSDTITPKVVVTAPVTEGTSPVDRHTGLNDPSPHQNRLDSSRWVLDATGQTFLIPSFTDGTRANATRKYKRQASVNFKSGTFAEYEEFKRTMKNMSKVLDWDDSQFGKEVFLSLSGKAAEHINDMPTTDICNTDKLFKKTRQDLSAEELSKSCLGSVPFFKIQNWQ